MQLHLICDSKAASPPESGTADRIGWGLGLEKRPGVGSHISDLHRPAPRSSVSNTLPEGIVFLG